MLIHGIVDGAGRLLSANTTPANGDERARAWLQRRFRRLVVRWEREDLFFQGFLQLAVLWQWVPLILASREKNAQEVVVGWILWTGESTTRSTGAWI